MIESIASFLPVLGAMAVTSSLTVLVIAILRKLQVMDHPNDRSSHTHPTPRGGGWAILGTILPVFLILCQQGKVSQDAFGVLAGTAILTVISGLDDRFRLKPLTRLVAQIAAVMLGLASIPQENMIFNGVMPLVLDRLLAACCWLWFINLFNFMDGIDGLAGSEAAFVTLALAVLAGLFGLNGAEQILAMVMGGACLGFLVWNWHPARVFLGDVGSVPLGFLIAGFLIKIALNGYLAAAFILPLYFVLDASLTLLRRLWRGHGMFTAHREHYFQKKIISGSRHSHVVVWVLALNAALFCCARWSVSAPWPATGVAVLLTGAVLGYFEFSYRAFCRNQAQTDAA